LHYVIVVYTIDDGAQMSERVRACVRATEAKRAAKKNISQIIFASHLHPEAALAAVVDGVAVKGARALAARHHGRVRRAADVVAAENTPGNEQRIKIGVIDVAVSTSPMPMHMTEI
jgi:hypothetical protein